MNRAARRLARGYTVVEVMSAMTLFAIGAAGVVSMQRVTVQGGIDARQYDVGANIAREWEHRLQSDSMLWTEPDSITGTSNRKDTQWLRDSEITATPVWKIPRTVTPVLGHSMAFDVMGRDVDETSPDRVFCVQYRLMWLAPESNPLTAVIRADIRVFWARLEYDTPACNDITVDSTANKNKYQFIYVSTALRQNPLR